MNENMAKHALVPAPTDVGERVKRTGLQDFLAALVVVVLLLPEVLRIFDEEIGEMLPPHFRAWLLGAAAVTAGLAMAFTRIMALPRVNDWLSRHTPFGTRRVTSKL